MSTSPVHTSAPSDLGPAIKVLRYSPNGRMLAAGDTARNVTVWQDGKLALRCSVRTTRQRLWAIDVIRALEFSADGGSLYISSGDATRELDLLTGFEVWKTERPPIFGFMITCPVALAVSLYSELGVAYDDGVLEIHAIDRYGKERKAKRRDNDCPRSMMFSPDGHRLIGSDGYSICQWDAHTGRKLEKTRFPDKIFAMLPMGPDRLAIRSLEHLSVWSISSKAVVHQIRTGIGLPTLAVSKTGACIACGDVGGFTIFDPQLKTLLRVPTRARVISLAFSPVADDLAVGTSAGTVAIFRSEDVPFLGRRWVEAQHSAPGQAFLWA